MEDPNLRAIKGVDVRLFPPTGAPAFGAAPVYAEGEHGGGERLVLWAQIEPFQQIPADDTAIGIMADAVMSWLRANEAPYEWSGAGWCRDPLRFIVRLGSVKAIVRAEVKRYRAEQALRAPAECRAP